ncbi:hypothetical protein [Hymenobacter jeollabukensis]|uniref:Lipoprotein n=1 Tax=Hymenobacter jeollabukensis TaxID=2025313 RepID=A0A5R8WWQ5_9BACT|nr:hypothetical protein [Hymenobacter jeollabukensis]TLM96662.1 hypothetical protein FDY95_01305 [Hymenobacter jeollabukensis]
MNLPAPRLRRTLLLPLLTLALLGGSGCKKVADAIKPKLPAETQEGKGTFGCLLDDKVWLPRSDHALLPPLHPDYNPGSFTLRASDDHDDAPGWEEFNLAVSAPDIVPGTYALGSGFTASYWRRDNDGANMETFTAGPADQGQLIITKVEHRTRTGSLTGQVVPYTIVSGTFAFTATSTSGGKIRVESGRFDVDPAD